VTVANSHPPFAPPLAWLDHLPEACVVFDAALHVVYCNPVFAARYGLVPDELVGKELPAFQPSFAGSVLHRLCQEALVKHTPQEAYETLAGDSFNLRAHPVPEGVMAFIVDVTSRRQVEQERVRPAAMTSVERQTPLPRALSAATVKPATVLIVDDEPFMRDLATRALRGVGYQTRTAASGGEALEMVRLDPAGVQLIVLDLSMPDMDGWETLEALRQLRGDIPVLVTSGRLDEETRSHNPGAAPSGYLAKPYSLEMLMTAVKQALGEK
jgi:PAS domain S-box-containing protein